MSCFTTHASSTFELITPNQALPESVVTEQECIVIKDVTVKQVTLNVTDMDQINIVSSQAVLEMSSFSMDKWCELDVFLASSKTDCSRPYETSMSRRFNSSTLWICHVIDTMLHDSPYLVIHRTEIWAVWRPQVGRKKVWCFLTHAVQLARARRGVPVHCPAGTKSLPDNLLIAGSSMTSL